MNIFIIFSYLIPLYDQLLFYRWVRLVGGRTPAGGGTSAWTEQESQRKGEVRRERGRKKEDRGDKRRCVSYWVDYIMS